MFTIAFTFIMLSQEPTPAKKQIKRFMATHKFQKELTKKIDFENNFWPPELVVDGKTFQLEYTFNKKLEKYVRRQLRRFFTKNASVVVIDNNTGGILTAVDYSHKGRHFGNGITFSTTHPAASLFKIVTAAALLDREGISPQSKFRVRGRGTTLYKYQLDNRNRSWDRKITLKNAFAYSNNVVFARAARKYLAVGTLGTMARDFGFNKNIYSDLLLSTSFFMDPTDAYNLAEKASGFNRETRISPVHGALLSMIVANNGIFKPVSVLKSIEFNGKDVKAKILSQPTESLTVMSLESNSELRAMMEQVPKKGTASRHMRRLVRKFRNYLSIGGKTGRISGGLPEGTRDWFSVFAQPKDGVDKGISICVMHVNGSSWYIKSSYIAKQIIQYYYTKIIPIKRKMRDKLVRNQVVKKGES